MSKAEEKALEAYPVLFSERRGYDNTFKDRRESYIKGYHQTEKDLELGWEDIPKLLRICEELKTSWWFRDNEQTKQIGKQPFWEEVLKRFRERKEK